MLFKKLFTLVLLVLISFYIKKEIHAQNDRIESFEKRKAIQQNSLVAGVEFENIGPTIFSGRVTDIDVNPDDPTHFMVAYASGGLWVTENNGTSFVPIFDHEAVMTIGDIAVNWQDSLIYVGTGEVNSSRSSYAGVGMYKSENWGKSWTHLGLDETHHIGKVIIDPMDNNIIYVAALGHLYSDNPERGIYKSTDAGANWTKTLFINDKTGFVDLILDPQDSKVLYAAAWQRERKAWNFVESGTGSGIYRSQDGGETWTLLSNQSSGFPVGEGVGRIGLSAAVQNGETKIYAFLDNYFRRPKESKEKDAGLDKDDFRSMSKDQFLNLKEEQISEYLKTHRFPKKYSTSKVIKMVKTDEILPSHLATYMESANSLLFDTPVIGAELYSSSDQGITWTKTHQGYLDRLYNSYGYYFGLVRTNPANADEIYLAGVPIIRSTDGGKTFSSVNGDNVHADHHALWINPNRAGHIINGNDGGINISYDSGANWTKCNSPSVGQFYYINVDQAKPYHVYGGLQDNGVWMGSHRYKSGSRWHSTGQYPYKSIMGGDGMQVQIDSRDNTTVYTGYQFGNYFRINTKTGNRKYITTRHDLGEEAYRWNWQSPIHLSVHNQDVLYMGANKLLMSLNQGDDFKEISDDITNGGKKGDVAYGTLSAIHESPLKFGLIYTGSDDGKVYRTTDLGNSWTDLSMTLPENLWISRVQASMHNESTVYLALNGYRNDDFKAYLYKSEDYGDTWIDISSNLPNEPINVVKEDPKKENIVYVGTDHGSYVSHDYGSTFMSFADELPAVAVHDIVIHPTEPHILIGTHGRSIYRADLNAVRSLTTDQNKDIYVYHIPDIDHNTRIGAQYASYAKPYMNPIKFQFYAKVKGSGKITILKNKKRIWENKIDIQKGIQSIEYDRSITPKYIKDYHKTLDKKSEKPEAADDGHFYILPGNYTVQISANGKIGEQNFVLKER